MRQAKDLARQLEKNHPGAAGSLREGLEEMFTVARLRIDGRLAKTLTTSNPIESMISIARATNRNVTRWRDGQMVRLIAKWVSAGVIEDGRWTASDQGAPQGASASPLLANIYLHYVLDWWARHWRKRHARGDMIIVRFADDFVAGFEHLGDAKQFLADLHRRFGRFGLKLHEDKTRLIQFGRFAAERRAERGLDKPETFDFLGFTHACAKTSDGRFFLKRITISKRKRAKLKEVKDQLKRRRHAPLPVQGAWLASVVRGHAAYYAVPGNIKAVSSFRTQATRCWYRALRRRSQRTRLTWKRMDKLATRWLPPIRVMHPLPGGTL